MLYATPQDLLGHVATSVQSLADVATPDDKSVVLGELLRLTLDAEDRSAFNAEDIKAADEALENIVNALKRGDDMISGYLRNRYPDTSKIAGDALLSAYCCDIALYQLYGLRTDDDVVRRYKDALKALEMIGSGKILLGVASAPDVVSGVGEPVYVAPATVFGADDLKDY